MHSTPVAGLDVTRLIAGSAPLPTPVKSAVDLLDEGWTMGIRVLDAADGIGTTESAAGRWLEDRQPEGIAVLAGIGTLVGEGRGTDLSPETVGRHLDSALRRLGRVDLAWLRGADAIVPLEATLTTLAEAIEAGRMAGWGLGGADVRQLDAALSAADRAGLARPVFLRRRMNLLERTGERDLLALAAGESVAVFAAVPLAGGRITDAHLAAEESAEAAARRGVARETDVDPDLEPLLTLRALARDRDVSTEGLAIATLLARGGVTATVVSPRAAAQWDAVHEALAAELADDELERIDALFPPS